MSGDALIELDVAIAALRTQILAGTANGQIALIQLLQLNQKRDELIRQIVKANPQPIVR